MFYIDGYCYWKKCMSKDKKIVYLNCSGHRVHECKGSGKLNPQTGNFTVINAKHTHPRVYQEPGKSKLRDNQDKPTFTKTSVKVEMNQRWEMVKCCVCASEGTHKACEKLEDCDTKKWQCKSCELIVATRTRSEVHVSQVPLPSGKKMKLSSTSGKAASKGSRVLKKETGGSQKAATLTMPSSSGTSLLKPVSTTSFYKPVSSSSVSSSSSCTTFPSLFTKLNSSLLATPPTPPSIISQVSSSSSGEKTPELAKLHDIYLSTVFKVNDTGVYEILNEKYGYRAYRAMRKEDEGK